MPTGKQHNADISLEAYSTKNFFLSKMFLYMESMARNHSNSVEKNLIQHWKNPLRYINAVLELHNLYKKDIWLNIRIKLANLKLERKKTRSNTWPLMTNTNKNQIKQMVVTKQKAQLYASKLKVFIRVNFGSGVSGRFKIGSCEHIGFYIFLHSFWSQVKSGLITRSGNYQTTWSLMDYLRNIVAKNM